MRSEVRKGQKDVGELIINENIVVQPREQNECIKCL